VATNRSTGDEYLATLRGPLWKLGHDSGKGVGIEHVQPNRRGSIARPTEDHATRSIILGTAGCTPVLPTYRQPLPPIGKGLPRNSAFARLMIPGCVLSRRRESAGVVALVVSQLAPVQSMFRLFNGVIPHVFRAGTEVVGRQVHLETLRDILASTVPWKVQAIHSKRRNISHSVTSARPGSRLIISMVRPIAAS
jgi:hypothetical protein